MSDDHSVTQMLQNLRDGQKVSAAQTLIWDRFFHRLKALAERKLDKRTRRLVDGDDIVVDAFHDFFSKIGEEGAFPRLTDRSSLWPLLAKITSCKAINEFKRNTAQKRGGGEVRGESVFINIADDDAARGIEQIERSLTPEYADELFMGFDSVLSELAKHDAKFYEVAILKLKGYSATEIAEELGYKNSKTPERILKQIRILWKSHYGGLARLKVFSSGGVEFETSINEETTVIGRQRQGDPDPYWTGVSDFKGEAIRRVIVAKNAEKSISRNHATIRVRDETKIEITNSSSKSQILINSETLLNPGAVWVKDSDCTLQLPKSVLRIELT